MRPDSKSQGEGTGRRTAFLVSILLFLLTFPIYLSTLAPGVYGFDSAELATGVYTQGIVHPPGYPLYLLIGKLFTFLPFGDIAYRLNVMSAFFASVTVALLFLAIDNIVENQPAAFAAALFLAISNYFWQMALVTEVYTVFTAFLAADLLIISLWRRRGGTRHLVLLAMMYGLTLTVHTSGILFAPAFAWLIVRSTFWDRSHWRLVAVLVPIFLATLSIPYIYLAFRAAAHPALDYSRIYPQADLSKLRGLWWFFSGRAYSIFAFAYPLREIPSQIGQFSSYLWRNYLGVGVVLGCLGVWRLWQHQREWAVGLLLMFTSNAVFYINYRVLDKDTMFLPAYQVWAVFLAAGMVAALELFHKYIAASMGEAAIRKTQRALAAAVLGMGLGLNSHWVDMSKASGYMLFAREMLSETAPDSIVIAPWSSAVVLEYYQIVDGQRPDLLILNRSRYSVARYYELIQQGFSHDQIMRQINSEEVDFIDRHIHDRTVYAVEYDPVLARQFEYLPEGPVFRLTTP